MGFFKEEDMDMQTDVVIVGGGLAGLTAGVGFAKCGLSSIVVEADSMLGGRARSWIDEATGDAVTVGPHIFLSKYPNMRKLLRVLGTDDKVVWQKGKFINIVDGQKEYEIGMARLPPPLHYAPSLMNCREYYPREDLKTSNGASFFAMAMNDEDVMKLDSIDALTFLKRQGVSDRFIRRFWEFSCMSIMNVPIDKCSAGSLLRFYKMLVSNMRYDVGFADGGLGDVFAPQAQDMIEKSGGRVLLNTQVKTVFGNGNKAQGIELADGSKINARYVIATLPPTDLGSIVPKEWAGLDPFSILDFFKPSPYISTYLWFDCKLTDKQFWARGFDPDDINCDFYDYDNIFTNRPNPGKSFITTNCIYSHRAEHMTDEEIVEVTIRELAEYLPEAKKAKILHSYVSRIPIAIHCPHPGNEHHRPPVRTSVENLLLAGDWIKTGLPSSMESACKAAWMAVESIMEQEGRPVKIVMPHTESQGIAWLINKAATGLRKVGLYKGADKYL